MRNTPRPTGGNDRGSIHNWWYHGKPVELLSMQLTSAVIRYPDSDKPFVIGRAGVEQWLR